MVKQYPDTLIVSEASESTQDANGDFIPGDAPEPSESPCRYEAASGSGYITTTDGRRIDFTGVVYLPKDTIRVKEGARVNIIVKRPDNPDVVLSDTVKRFFRGQLNARIWL